MFDVDGLDFGYSHDLHYENGEFAASSSASQDGSVSRWSVVASSSSTTMSCARSLSPFEDDAFEKAAAAAETRNSAIADCRRQQQQQRRKPINKNGKKVQLIKVLEDFLLSRTNRPRKPRPFDDNGQKPILTDPLSSLFEPIVDKLTVDSPAAPIAGSRKRKSREEFTPPLSAKRRARKQPVPALVTPVKKIVRNSFLINGDALSPTKLKVTLNNHFAKASKANLTLAKKTKVAIAEVATVASTTTHKSRKRKRQIMAVMTATAAAPATIEKTKEKMAPKVHSKQKKVLNGRKRLKRKRSVRTSTTKEILDKLKDTCSEIEMAAVAAAVKTVVPEVKVKRRRSGKKLKVSTEDAAEMEDDERASIEAVVKQHQAVAVPVSNSRKPESENKSEKICQKCEKADENLIRCEGMCRGMFHTKCISMAESTAEAGDSEPKKCVECTTGLHSCFACKSNEGEVHNCSTRGCGKFYHLACLAPFRAASFDPKGTFTCPVHYCLSCVLFRDKKRARKGNRLLRCVRCPVAYHGTEACLAAGSVMLTNAALLCPAHQAKKSRIPQINVNWCFMCSHGGTLICCETCPASFHAECLNIETPEGSYYCAECQSKSQPKYGDILWVKLGNYRWWPAKVCNQKNVPPNIQSVPHGLGDFAVRFFGTYDYYWTRRSRTFQFLEGDHVANTGATNKLGMTFKKALEEAVTAFQKWKNAKETREAYNHQKNNMRPPKYIYLKANRPVGIAATAVSVAEPSSSCDCEPLSENPCGPNSECLNRLLLLECSPSTCPAGERCQNQQFVKQQYVKAEIFRAEGKGWGLRSLEDIFKGQFVNEYVGEIIDENECKRRMKKMQEENDTAYYFLTLDKDRIIDAGKKGNLSRFMNHSCQPNCELRKWTVNGDTRVGLFALTDIPSGTELTFNYNLECLGNEKTQCRCGALNCSGFIGERPKALASVSQNKKALKPRRRKRRADRRRANYDSECFRCGLDGELLLCDRRKCTKAFHLGCLNLAKAPHGRWECPWHHCDTCGKTATVLCTACPNSFCSEHVPKNVQHMSDGTVICQDHEASTEEQLEMDATPTQSPVAEELNETLDESGTSECNERVEEEDGDASETATKEAIEVPPTNELESTEETTLVPDLAAVAAPIIVNGEDDDQSSIKENGVSETTTAETNGCECDKSPSPPPPLLTPIVLVETTIKKGPKQKNTVNGDVDDVNQSTIVS